MDHKLPVIFLSKGNSCYRRRFLVAVLLFLGAGLHACLTVPKSPESEEVLISFVYSGHHDSVCLSADFNGWSPESHCLQRNGEEWSIQVALLPGRYNYGFILDKKVWACDPDALIQENDGFGRKNSVLIIDSAVTKRPAQP
jgi:hypothetical protein